MLHERLKEARTKAGLSQEKVAKECGITQPAYFDIEHGDRAPSLAVAKRLANLFGVSLDWLVGTDADGKGTA